MLLQDFFTSARLLREHNCFTEECCTLFVRYLKSNIIGQRKTTNTEKHFA